MAKSEKRRRPKPKREDRRRSRAWRPLWALLGLFGLAMVATVLSSRRIRPMEDEDWDSLLDDDEPGAPPFPSVEMRIDGPAGELVVDDGGSGGLPVLFVHSLGGSAAQWRAQLDHLRPERRALALELRAHGRSAPAGGDGEGGGYGVEALAGDVAAAADDLGLDRFVLAGHSLGGSVAIEYAARHPERIAGLLLVDPAGDQSRAPKSESESFLATLRADPEAEFRFYFKQILLGAAPGVAEQVLADLDRVPPEALLAALESLAAYSPVAALARYPGPKLTVVTELNSLPHSLHRLLADLPAVVVHGTSHWLMMDRPELFNQTLDGFLARLEAPAEAAG